MKTIFIKLLFLTLLICLCSALIGCSITTPSSESIESEFFDSQTSETVSSPEESTGSNIPEIPVDPLETTYEEASKTFKLKLNENKDGYVVLGFSSSWDSSQKDITIPDFIDGIPITEIGESAFYYYDSFNSFYLPYTLKILGDFSMPQSAGNMVKKESVKYLGSKTNPYVVAIKCVSDTSRNIKIQEGCKFIYSFFGHPNLVSVSFPSSLLQIGCWAFSYCDFTKLDFNEGLTSIGNHAFYPCENVTEINLPNSLEKIEREAFDCPITELFIPKNVREIGKNAFNSHSLAEITVDNENKYFSSKDGILYDKEGTSLIMCPRSIDLQEFTVPYGVEKICQQAFWCNKFIERLILPNTVTTIGSSAFENMRSLKYISLPNSVIDVGYLSFPLDGSIEFNEKDGGLYLGSEENPYLYLVDCNKFEGDFAIADTCKYVGEEALGFVHFTELTVPKSVISFGDNAFYGASIEKVVYEGTALDWCNIDFYSEIHREGMYQEIVYGSLSNPLMAGTTDLYIDGEILTEMIFPEGTTKIKGGVFYGYLKLTNIVIPDGVTEIGNLAFAYCENLENLELPNSIRHIGAQAFISCQKTGDFALPEELITIGESAFANCTGLTKITIPDKVTSIGDEVFYNCSNVIDVVIGKSVEKIGYDAFSNCERIINAISKSPYIVLDKDVYNCGYLNEMATFLYNAEDMVTTNYEIDENGFVTVIDGEEIYLVGYLGNSQDVAIPDGITVIYDDVFNHNSNLISVTIPNSVKEIKDQAFWYCTNLQSVNLSPSLKIIGSRAFSHCSSLEEIILHEGLETIMWSAFNNSGLTHIEIPDSVISIGTSAFYCTPLQSVKIGSGVKTLESMTFSGCASLETIDLGSVITIGIQVFQNCNSLKELTLPNSVTQIDARAFMLCENLETIVFGDNLESIGEYAFNGCTSLKTLSLTKNIKVLGECAFIRCTGLESVTIGVNVAEIGSRAFEDCENLSELIYTGTSTEWQAIKIKTSSAFSGTKVYSVVCTEETIEIKRY